MNRIKFLIPVAVVASTLASCNKSNRINRIIFETTSFNVAQLIHDNMITAQKRDDNYPNLYKKGTITFKYNANTNGVIKFSESYNQIVNLNLLSDTTVSWSLTDNYIKVAGNKETNYYIKDGNTYWKCHQDDNDKTRVDITADVSNKFNTFTVNTINNACTIQLMTLFCITAGIDGDTSSSATITENPSKMFSKATYDSLSYLSNLYSTSTQGHYLDLTYGAKEKSAISFLCKGKINARDFPGEDRAITKGEMDLDLFTSFKDNFVSQVEVIFSGRSLNIENTFTAILDADIYLSQEIKVDECTIDKVNINDYKK